MQKRKEGPGFFPFLISAGRLWAVDKIFRNGVKYYN